MTKNQNNSGAQKNNTSTPAKHRVTNDRKLPAYANFKDSNPGGERPTK